MRLYSDTLPAAADLYGDIEPAPNVRWRDYLPGLMVAWAGIVGVNAVFAWGNRGRRRS